MLEMIGDAFANAISKSFSRFGITSKMATSKIIKEPSGLYRFQYLMRFRRQLHTNVIIHMHLTICQNNAHHRLFGLDLPAHPYPAQLSSDPFENHPIDNTGCAILSLLRPLSFLDEAWYRWANQVNQF